MIWLIALAVWLAIGAAVWCVATLKDGEITLHDLVIMLPCCAIMGPLVLLVFLGAMTSEMFGDRVLWRRRK